MNWSARVFFFGFVAYLIYVFAIGDASKWAAIFTTKQTSSTPPTSAGNNPATAITPGGGTMSSGVTASY